MHDDDALTELKALYDAESGAMLDDGFAMRVIHVVAKRRQRRNIIIGAIGAIGSAIAGAQLTFFFSAAEQIEGMEQLAAFGGAETLAATVVAGTVAAVAWMLPNRV